ncbi:hypothetical protein DLAC_07638 [Tieghemostelium lacteum]|uniref:Uncharacterized protein n=1 Tax=Tieghemostelium lacteum TaxID=361077 RepID=A0A151ZD14_TIELA|nr:hypothetical protein DLAC_07638 [Tieghemostelium lacteum]|eukprot:KYQ91837.1 hypothetical protein DLAC_07638 [Tieghemostelium lacteum]
MIKEVISLLESQNIFSKKFNNTVPPSENEIFPKSLKNYLTINKQTSEIYYFSPIETKLYVCKIHKDENDNRLKLKYQEIKLNIQQNLQQQVFKIELSNNDRYLAIHSISNCYILDLGPLLIDSLFSNEIESSTYNSIQYGAIESSIITIDKESQFYQVSYVIQQIEWHPLSENHLVLLYSNNHLKIYNVSKEQYERDLDLDNIDVCQSTDKSTKNNRRFISFSFGNCSQWNRFTMYLVTDKGVLYYICPLVPNNSVVDYQFYQQLKSDIVKNKLKAAVDKQTQLEKYYEQQYKWLLLSTVNGKTENDFGKWIRFSSQCNTNTPILQGPIYSNGSLPQETPIQLVTISSPLDTHQQQQQQKLTAFLLVILFQSGKLLVLLSTFDSKPMFTIDNPNNTSNSMELVEYEILDLGTKEHKSSSSLANRGMKYDEFSETLFAYNNSGVYSIHFPWLSEIDKMIHSKTRTQTEPSGSTSLIQIIQSGNNNIIALDSIISNRFGKFLLVIPSNFTPLIIERDIIIQSQERLSTLQSDTKALDKDIYQGLNKLDQIETRSPLQSQLSTAPPVIPRISLNHNQKLNRDLIMSHLLSLKDHIFVQLSYCNQLDSEVRNRIQQLEKIQNLDHLKQFQMFKTNFERLKLNHVDLTQKSKIIEKIQDTTMQQIDLNIQTIQQGTPLSDLEIDYIKQLKSIDHNLQVFDSNIDKISKQIDSINQQKQKSTESNIIQQNTISDQTKLDQIEQVLTLQSKKIDNTTDHLESLFKFLAELSLGK